MIFLTCTSYIANLAQKYNYFSLKICKPNNSNHDLTLIGVQGQWFGVSAWCIINKDVFT